MYANLSHQHRTKKDLAARKRAEYLASLPKNPFKRLLYRLHPKRVAKFWFSKRGALAALKIVGIGILVLALFIGGLFAYYRKSLDAIRPSELAKRVQTTVSDYYDRNGNLLWEDKGTGNYQLVVKSDQLNTYLKQATVAIEDRSFYKHGGVSFTGIVRAAINNTSSDSSGTQGGSTLTQQLVKQVFFADQAQQRGLSGIPRKIKEMILSVEVERMYNKDQILTLYLNESPYGGRRNGAESAAQTYFGKSAKDLTLPEAALLASIPQSPSTFNPYNVDGHKELIARQHTTLDNMVAQGYITKAQADEAKKVPILDTIKPESTQYTNIKAAHFVQMVRAQLVKELGAATVGKGGLKITTTLDLRIQNKLESEMQGFFATGKPEKLNIDNGAATLEDTKTGQIIALDGSRDFNYPGFGQDNAATSYIQPGSTVKPFVYAQLFKDKGSGQQNYGTGSILSDVNIDSLYGAQLRNWDNRFMGNITIRQALALSRNIPAVKAMYINGIQPTIDAIHTDGNTGYCSQEQAAGGIGLSSAIGACGSKQTDMVSAYTTLARGGNEIPQSTILEVKNSNGDTLKKWQQSAGKQVIDPQIAYMLNDILGDTKARVALHGYNPPGLYVPGVKVAGKTGTSDRNSIPKDLWVDTYSPSIVMSLWIGNSNSQTIGSENSVYGGSIVTNVMEYAHTQVYQEEGLWKPNDWWTQPAGIQKINNELYPSWWNKKQTNNQSQMSFDKLSKKKATSCTPDGAKVELTVTKSTDPITKKDTYIAPDGYDATSDDDKHSCNDSKPSVDVSVDHGSDNTYKITAHVSQGTFGLTGLQIQVNGQSVASPAITSGGDYSASVTVNDTSAQTVTATVTDAGYYTGTISKTFQPTSSGQ